MEAAGEALEVTMAQSKKTPPIHPGEILQEEFLAPLEISQYRLAKDTRAHQALV
jgi:plasmid maintenance system antidote protein VapI